MRLQWITQNSFSQVSSTGVNISGRPASSTSDTQKGVPAGKIIGPRTCSRFSLPQSSSTIVSAKGNAVPTDKTLTSATCEQNF